MKKTFAVLCVSLFLMASLLAKSVKEYTPSYDNEGKRVPAVAGGFEFIQGQRVFAPIQVDAFEKAAVNALSTKGYVIRSREPGVITYVLIRRDYDLTMKLHYNEKEYWYEYIDSTNLEADPLRNRIHKSYYRWQSNLDQEIGRNYQI